jgi:hypothetical protein
MAMTLLKYSLVILHIITASAWFGLGLRLAGQARSVVDAGPERGSALVTSTARSVGLMNWFALLTLVLGVGTLFAGGGFAVYGWPYHASITTVLLLVLVQYFVIRPGWSALESALGTDADAARSAVKRVAAGTGAGHLLWLVTLVLMYLRQFGIGVG